MLSTLRSAALLTLTGAALLVACRKNDPSGLEGPVPAANFTVALNTSQYPVVATFTNTTADGFIYQWDFGDGTPLVSGQNATHIYRTAGTFQAKLIAAGRGGTGTSPARDVVIPSLCDNTGYAVLTACAGSGATTWALDTQPGAITRLSASGAVLSQSTAPLSACQADDQFSFTKTFAYSYDAGSATAAGNCGTAPSGNSDFTYVVNGSLGRLTLLRNGAFLGTPDSVVNKTYEIVEATPTRLKLQGTLPNGDKLVVTYMPQLSLLDRTKQLLTGGSSRTWVLDNAAQAVIMVGPTDANPGGYYPGGSPNSLPGCQADDEYTFTSGDVLNYDAKAETFVAGTPSGSCQAPRTYSSPFTFGPASGPGIAQFELSRAGSFIAVTDAPDLVYRIQSIDNQKMVLRAGKPTAGTIFTIKLRVK